MRITLVILLTLFFADLSFGQKFLQLERVHSPKTRKYFPGHELTFQLSNGQWYTRVIEDISYEQKLIVFIDNNIHVDSITAVRSYKNQQWSRPLGNQLFNFAIAWTVFSVIDEAVSDDPFEDISKSTYMIPAASVGVGILIKNLFRKRTFRMEKNKEGEAKRWRLRVLDLDVKRMDKNP